MRLEALSERTLPPDIESTMLEMESFESAANDRASRLWRFLAVTIVVWAAYCAYFCFRSYTTPALVCFSEAAVSYLFLLRFRRMRQNYHLLMHGYLTMSAIGLFTLSISQGANLANTIYFVPCCIIIGAYLIGVWAALLWCFVSIGLTCLHYSCLGGVTQVSPDQLVNAVCFSATIFFLCQQAEIYHEKRTRTLIQLSSRLRHQSRKMRKLATTDPLTGLDNRLCLVDTLEKKTKEAIENKRRLAVMVVDMDGFKEVNDALGHGVGDQVLQVIARKLREALNPTSTVARLGGDEFCILVPNIDGPYDAETVATNLARSLRKPFRIDQDEIVLDASIGICICPDMSSNPEELMRFADTAMYHAKPTALRHMLYSPTMTDEVVQRLAKQEQVTQALERDEFRLVFQPQVDIELNTVTSVEALLRWTHDGKNIPPLDFIPLLESTGEIVKVSNWIVHQCCIQLQRWNEIGHQVRIAINLSAVEFSDPKFFDSVAEHIRNYGLTAEQLEFEITEGLLVEDIPNTIKSLAKLKDMGCSVSIDDFGTGYSSLSYLKQFPIDRLKIDRAFVKDIPNQDDGLLASSIIVLAKSLGMKVIAEGVETKEQLDFLGSKGCDEYQGYYLSPPVTPEECERYFQAIARIDA